ncbi:M23 family metallopeptidase [Algoriphagus winogradskyi]|uniref:Murein DD-endopeptidase MepM and murein hydrolase activator NlpD, contain LysM domain n=1 Tax=Algoriphagus winogradskyi TaxID=237017 RepID=A0ABY1NVB7_9BACT|nr:M23 family metallopeptidase [Algoriphagus winogradskyi]SMP16870.1 Murein DD-endopeptidase MepM and murein hydrolase activator NlpD, contain LysM domain [Algoriphagus winogradskyi]
MQRKLSIILLFVAYQAFPQFNSFEFRKELTSVKVIKSTEFKQETKRPEIPPFSEPELTVEKEGELVLASLPLEDFSLTSEFGYRSDPFSGEMKFHRAIDLKTKRSKVLSMLHGTVVSVGNDPLLGIFVKVQHGNYESIYAHLSQSFVAKGERVLPGTILGISGSTGRATGDHLHLSIKKGNEYVNPVLFIQLISRLSTKEEAITYLSKP